MGKVQIRPKLSSPKSEYERPRAAAKNKKTAASPAPQRFAAMSDQDILKTLLKGHKSPKKVRPSQVQEVLKPKSEKAKVTTAEMERAHQLLEKRLVAHNEMSDQVKVFERWHKTHFGVSDKMRRQAGVPALSTVIQLRELLDNDEKTLVDEAKAERGLAHVALNSEEYKIAFREMAAQF